MRVYDDRGNMIDATMGDFSRDMGADVSDLFDKLFAEGMTVLEARGLIGYITTNLDFCASLSIARHQMEDLDAKDR